MTPERKEIDFWLSIGEEPPFVKECGINWEETVENHKRTLELERDEMFQIENEKYLAALSTLTQADVDAFNEEGTIPASILKIVTLGSDMCFRFNEIPSMTPSTGGNIFDDISLDRTAGDIEIELFRERNGD
jgi:hypothetical protein